MAWGWRNRTRGDRGSDTVVAALRAVGASVFVVGRPLDLLVGLDGVTMLVEVKASDGPPSKRALSPSQEKFIEEWKGGTPLVVDERNCVAVVLRAVGRRQAC